jgi:hypothetical protein
VRYRERDRAAAIELALELLATGRVRGVSPDHDPARLEAAIGSPDSERILDTGLALIRDYGLLEAHYSRASPQAPWRGDRFMAGLRWLKKPLKWKILGPELRRLGYDVIRRPRPDLGADYYEVTESSSTASIFKGNESSRLWGHLYSVHSTAEPQMPESTPDFNAVHRTVYAATGQDSSSWPGWLAQHGGADPDRLRTAERTVYVVLREHPSRAVEGVAFHAYLLDQAAAVWPADEWAYRFARFAAEHRDLPGVPTADTVASHCLAALPMDRPAAARLPTDWRVIAPTDVRASKMTHALLRYARDAAPQETATIAELIRWDEVLTRLC